MRVLVFCALLLLLPTGAWALPYSLSVDVASLTFSRPAEMTAQWQQQTLTVLDRDTHCGLAADTSGAVCAFTKAEDGIFLRNWEEHQMRQALPGVGEARSFAGPTRMGAEFTLTGSGYLQSLMEHNAWVVVTESGPLTISLDYAITHSGAPADSDQFGLGDFRGFGHTELHLATLTGADVALAEFAATRGESGQFGTLSVTQYVTAGHVNFLNIGIYADVTQPRGLSVPEPSSWLLCFIGLVIMRWACRKWKVAIP